MLDEQGTIVNSYAYDAFGNTLSQVEGIDNIYKYAGQQYDERLGQYYLRARYYDPVFGRFTQEDTYRGDGNNLYAYVKNNPLKYVDPSGHRSEGKDCGIDIGYEGTLDSIMLNTGSAKVDKLNQALLLPTVAGTSIVGNNSLDSLVKMLTILTMMGSYQSMDSIIGYSPDSFADNITNPIGTIMDKIFHAETNDGDEGEAKSDDEGTSETVEVTAGKNFKDHFIRHKKILEDALGTKYPKFKSHGQQFLDDIGQVINDGTVDFIGQGTLKKGQDAMNIYRGNGMTIVTKPNGEFVTILETGKGLDLGIQFLD